jgi:hypothetical protein
MYYKWRKRMSFMTCYNDALCIYCVLPYELDHIEMLGMPLS